MLLSVLQLLLSADLVPGMQWGKERLDRQSACPFRGLDRKPSWHMSVVIISCTGYSKGCKAVCRELGYIDCMPRGTSGKGPV